MEMKIWQFKTEKSFIKSQKKLSMLIVNDKVFNNSLGDINAVDIASGNMLWQQPTQTSSLYEDTFFSLKTSDLIASNDIILFSNNKNEFFSLRY